MILVKTPQIFNFFHIKTYKKTLAIGKNQCYNIENRNQRLSLATLFFPRCWRTPKQNNMGLSRIGEFYEKVF